MNPLLLALAFFPALASAAEDELPGPVTVQVGYSGMYPGTRELSGHHGVVIGVGLHDRDGGFFGQRGIELDYRFAQLDSGRVDDLSLIYVERFPLQNQVYGLLGVGAWGFRIVDHRDNGFGTFTGLQPGAKAAVGYQFQLPDDDVRLAVELAGIAVLPVNTYTTSGLTAALVLGF